MLMEGLIAAVVGGIASSLVTVSVVEAESRNKFALDFIKQYMSNYDQMADALGILERAKDLKHGELEARPRDLNRVIKLGDWGEMFAVAYHNNMLNKKIFTDLEFRKQFRDFFTRIDRLKDGQSETLASSHVRWSALYAYTQREDDSI